MAANSLKSMVEDIFKIIGVAENFKFVYGLGDKILYVGEKSRFLYTG